MRNGAFEDFDDSPTKKLPDWLKGPQGPNRERERRHGRDSSPRAI